MIRPYLPSRSCAMMMPKGSKGEIAMKATLLIGMLATALASGSAAAQDTALAARV